MNEFKNVLSNFFFSDFSISDLKINIEIDIDAAFRIAVF